MRIETWPGLTDYAEGVARMEAAVAEVLAGGEERVVFCEHSPVLTVGSSGNAADAAGVEDIPVVETGRGGKVTYHGPGQRVVYLVVRLERWGKDVRGYVKWLQEWLQQSLKELSIETCFTDDIGVWTKTSQGLEKIAAVGVRVRKGVAFHGVALNVDNDLGVYKRFVPCGIADKGVTSLRALGFGGGMENVDGVLKAKLAGMMPG